MKAEVNMELKDTVELMLSDNYEDRLKAEYLQVVIRLGGLLKYLENNTKEKYKGEYTDLTAQLSAMCRYRDTLYLRFENIGIELPEV